MSNAEIYFFSGTGNSYIVAKDLAHGLDAKIISVISLIEDKVVKTEADMIGIIFPIYDFKAPLLIEEFIKKLNCRDDAYIFAVCTFGVLPIKTMVKFRDSLLTVNKKLSGGFTIKMPHNGVGYREISLKKQKQMFEEWAKRCPQIIQYVQQQKTGLVERNSSLYYLVLLGILIRMMPSLLAMLKEALFHGWDSLGFAANEQCNSCGLCEKICPVDNISMKNNAPVWSDKCLNCFACLQWCPKEAINAGVITQKMKRYHHPQVSIKDIINQKRK
jgi:ferredoxin